MSGLPATRRNLLLGLGGTLALVSSLAACAKANAPAGQAAAGFDAALNDLHRRTFNYFWETSDAATGLAPDNWPNPDFCSVAAVGFALTAYCIGTKSGYVTRDQAAQRTVATLRTFWNGPQGDVRAGMMGYKGFFYHFLDMKTGLRFKNVELSSIDTSLFLNGALTAAGFFDGSTAVENEIRQLAINIYERVDWTFMARDNGLISMGWHPESGLPDHDARGLINRNWDHYNEGMMVYLLALGSPTHAVPATAWTSWAATLDRTWGTNYGETYLGFSPMFGHQYSHIWFDFRGIADAYMRGKNSDYFTNSTKATRAQRQYAIENPGHFRDYGADIWGLTACRGPKDVEVAVDGRQIQFHEYGARGPATGDGESFDDGTIAPTAALGSMPFAPDICTAAAKAMVAKYGSDVYGEYGFFDSFNPSFPATIGTRTGHATKKAGWVAYEYLAIDQGPILTMLENHRSSLVWDVFNRSPATGAIVRRAFTAAGFTPIAASGNWLKT